MSFIVGLVAVLGVLIFFHELGHFLCAKAFGVGVEKFSLGFGPKILGKTIGRTQYLISAVPLGGYVKMVGEQPDVEIDPADIPLSFTHKHVAKRMLIVAAGPFFNFFLAVLIFFGVFLADGITLLQPVVGEVKPGSPAQSAGLADGDRVLAIDAEPVKTWSDMAVKIMDSHGKPLVFLIARGGEVLEMRIAPETDTVENIFGEAQQRYFIGVTASGETVTQSLGPMAAFVESLDRTYFIIKLTLVSVVKLVQGVIPAKTLGGPILIAQMAGEQASQGALPLLFFIALVSVNLGILNLLPIPVLDGGHILFFAIEAVTGRPLSIKTREIAQQVGIFFLLLLMVFVFYNDIMRLFSSG
jgi:regulator of sigma E protease